MATVACCVCSANICLTDGVEKELRQSHAMFYCPAGHGQSFQSESDRDRAVAWKAKAEMYERQARDWRDRWGELREAVSACPMPDCEWETHAGTGRIIGYLIRHLEKEHSAEIPKLKAVS